MLPKSLSLGFFFVLGLQAMAANEVRAQTSKLPPRLARYAQVEVLPDPIESTQYTLWELEQLALRYNPTLAAAAARVAAARGQQLQAGLFPNPKAGYHATEIANQGTAGQQGGFASQRFITGGKLRLDRAVAGRTVDEARFGLFAQQRRVMSDVQIQFYDAHIAQRRVELTEQLTKVSDELVTATKTLLAGRLSTENDLLQAEIKAEETRILLDNARNHRDETWRRLVSVVGLPALAPGPLVSNLEVEPAALDWDDCYGRVLAGNPELASARARRERAALATRRARREPIPDFDLSVSVRHHNVPQDNVMNVQLGIPLPIFDRNQGNIQSARAEWLAASHDIRRIELRLQDQLAVAFRRYANASQQVGRYRERILPHAERSLRLVTDGYEKGQVKYLNVLAAQQTYVQVNLSYLESLKELRTASAVIDGQMLTDSLGKAP